MFIKNPSTPPSQRAIRVFISSTFRDMHQERDELVKFVFPKLRKICEERAVVWSEIDLRWGITDEEKAEGKVLPLCLAEIDRCRPYFIGLLGERYGWVPSELPPENLDREPWLSEDRKRSVTEIEILHGVLRNPNMADHAFFYFRDPGYVETLPPEMRREFCERPAEDEVESLGPDQAEHRAEERRRKLEALKNRIRRSGLPVREDYRDPKELGRLVLQDLSNVIDALFPAESIPDAMEKEAAEQAAFAESRRGVYFGRDEYLRRLDAHARGAGPPLIVLGAPGSGKSALLSNWASTYRERNPGQLLVTHFVGSSSSSTDWMAMLRRLMTEIQGHFHIPGEIPGQPEALRLAFANWLHMVPRDSKVVMILDGLNQLEDRDGAPDLNWLPYAVPPQIRIVLATLPGRSLEALHRYGWPSMEIEQLNPDERQNLIAGYLEQYAKKLGRELIKEIARADQTGNPLYLCALLEELRVFGEKERLGERIAFYLGAKTTAELYDKILARYEQDYEDNRPRLVGAAMSLLWAARRGLSEAELLDMLGAGGQALPAAYWSPLFLAAERALVRRSGRIGFSNDHFRQAVERRYLETETKRRAVHLAIADYFGVRDLGLRKIDEFPWQLAKAESWGRLHDVLTDIPFFFSIWRENKFEALSYWAELERRSPYKLKDAYHRAFKKSAEQWIAYPFLAMQLFLETGHLDEVIEVCDAAIEHCRRNGDLAGLQLSLGHKIAVLGIRGDLDGASHLTEERLKICRTIGDKLAIGSCLGSQADILSTRGDLDRAQKIYKELERICRDLGSKQGLARALGSQAGILAARGDPDGAWALYKEQEWFYRELGDLDGLSRSLESQGLILKRRGDLDEAMALFKSRERVCRDLGDRYGLQVCLERRGNILHLKGDLDGAMELYKEQERICREMGDQSGLQNSLGDQALVYTAHGDFEKAMALHKEEERISRDLGEMRGISKSLHGQGQILAVQGDLEGALRLYKEGEKICRKLGNKFDLMECLADQALLLYHRGDGSEALALFQEEGRLRWQLGDKLGLAKNLGNQARLLLNAGNLKAALERCQEQERHYRTYLKKPEKLQDCLSLKGTILKTQGDMEGALGSFDEQGRICRELGNKRGLAQSLASQALIYFKRGDWDRAMALHREEESLYRDLGDRENLAGCLINQANVLYGRGDFEGALKAYESLGKTCRELTTPEMLIACLVNQTAILMNHLDQPRRAEPLAREAHELASRHRLKAHEKYIEQILAMIRSRI